MAAKEILLPDQLHKYLDFNPSTGEIWWKPRVREDFPSNWAFLVWNKAHSGKPALSTLAPSGYKVGPILNKTYASHRVLWALVTGEWPDVIDHINGNRQDNRLENLRSITKAGNHKNTKRPATNTSGHMGVSWAPLRGKWRAAVYDGKKQTHAGYFADKDAAIAAAAETRDGLGYHANHGRD